MTSIYLLTEINYLFFIRFSYLVVHFLFTSFGNFILEFENKFDSFHFFLLLRYVVSSRFPHGFVLLTTNANTPACRTNVVLSTKPTACLNLALPSIH